MKAGKPSWYIRAAKMIGNDGQKRADRGDMMPEEIQSAQWLILMMAGVTKVQTARRGRMI